MLSTKFKRLGSDRENSLKLQCSHLNLAHCGMLVCEKEEGMFDPFFFNYFFLKHFGGCKLRCPREIFREELFVQ